MAREKQTGAPARAEEDHDEHDDGTPGAQTGRGSSSSTPPAALSRSLSPATAWSRNAPLAERSAARSSGVCK